MSIEQDVEAEYLEAGATAVMRHEAATVVLLECPVRRYQRLYDDVIDIGPEFSDVVTVLG